MDTLISLGNAFISIHDPRIDRTKKHKLVDIIMITLCATICGMEGWEDIEIFAEEREEWFRKFLELPNGIPSHDTMYRVFSRINPKELNKILIEWTQGLNKSVDGKVVAIDGKTLRGSFDTASGQSALHMISAWVEENGLVLGQVCAGGKGHEITKIPELLRLLELKNSIVTIDAIGCQKEIVRIIREEKTADYVIALKKNQLNLHDEVVACFNLAGKSDFFSSDKFESIEKGHGRIESRACVCLDVAAHLDHVGKEFSGLKTVAKIYSTRECNGKTEEQTRYFISSLPCKAEQIAKAVRTHWSVENSLHWRLDMTFKEDASRIRKDNAPENLAMIRRTALGLVKNRLPQKMTVKRAQLRMKLNWDFALAHFFTNN
ncbi:MAG: ISAs1 family transposase [Deltaproteobacteria bacterium]|jgi:predicted transposase YbfD/YdcC|nr:ISAs1 family transposase [Deltaproteobacteria bacterium]